MTVLSVEKPVELEEVNSPVEDNVSDENEAVEAWLLLPLDDLVVLDNDAPEDDSASPSPIEVVSPGTVKVPRLSSVTATSDVGTGICVVALPSLTATSRKPAVTVTSGTRGRMILPGLRRWNGDP